MGHFMAHWHVKTAVHTDYISNMIAKHGRWEVEIEQIKQEVIHIRLFQ